MRYAASFLELDLVFLASALLLCIEDSLHLSSAYHSLP